MNKKKKRLNSRGSSLIEALISMLIIAFVIVSILNGFSQQQLRSRNMSDRAIAVQLAELRLEELLKFTSQQVVAETYIDYIVAREDGFVVYDEAKQYNPSVPNQFRRTTKIELDPMGQMASLSVKVEYPLTKGQYPFKIEVHSKRGVK